MKIITVSACLVVSVLADSLAARQSAPFIGSPGFGCPGSISSPSVVKDSTQQLFESAGRSPNETSSASFVFFPGNVSSPESNITWSWRVNITDVVIPEQVSPGGLHVVNEQWQLQWPEGGSLESYMARSGIDGTFSTSLCLSAGVFTLPSNVTSRIPESNRNNCSEILGSECVRGILQSGFPGCEGSGFRTPMACMDTLGVAISSSSQSTNGESMISSRLIFYVQARLTIWIRSYFTRLVLLRRYILPLYVARSAYCQRVGDLCRGQSPSEHSAATRYSSSWPRDLYRSASLPGGESRSFKWCGFAVGGQKCMDVACDCRGGICTSVRTTKTEVWPTKHRRQCA